MWVLEARYKAEKVWYTFVWEDIDYPSNVVDYDIHWEITKDTSNVINANNQTTTGMANIIPWINSPKLLEDTSIIKKAKTLSATAYAALNINNISWANSPKIIDLTQFTMSWEEWTLKFTQTPYWLKPPALWTYIFTVSYPQSRNDLSIKAELMQGDTVLHSHICSTSVDTEMFAVNFSSSDPIFFRTTSNKIWAEANWSTSLTMDIVKL